MMSFKLSIINLTQSVKFSWLVLYQVTQESKIRSMHQYSYSKVLSAKFKFSARQSLAEEKYSTILQTRRNVLKIVRKPL